MAGRLNPAVRFTEPNTVERMVLEALSSRSGGSRGALVLRESPPISGMQPALRYEIKSGIERIGRFVLASFQHLVLQPSLD